MKIYLVIISAAVLQVILGIIVKKVGRTTESLVRTWVRRASLNRLLCGKPLKGHKQIMQNQIRCHIVSCSG